jgi:hypothetical protein
MKIVIGTQKSKLKTDNPKILKALSNLYSFKIPGAEFTPAYKRRQWDGKKRFFTRGGQFGTGMLPSILADLEKIDCVPELEYKNERPESLPLKSIDPFTYFDYQHESIRHALDNHRCIIKAPTGAGKTLIMAGIVKSLMGKKMVILFNAKSLLKQTYDFFVNECGFNNVGVCFGEGYEDGDIMLCTVQSIERIIDNYVTDAEVVMVDEVHEFANGEFTVAAIESFPNAPYRYGFTATVPQDPIPRWTLISAFGPIYTCRTTQDLIEDNVLTKPIIQMLKVPESEVDDSELGYRGVYEELIVNNETRNNMIKDIVDDIRSNHEQARILVLVRDLEHGRILQEGIGASGIPQYAALQSVEKTQFLLERRFCKQELTYAKSHISSMLEGLKARLQPYRHSDALFVAMTVRMSYLSMISWIQENILLPTQLNDFQPM